MQNPLEMMAQLESKILALSARIDRLTETVDKLTVDLYRIQSELKNDTY